jgi:hypothetical protein
VHHIGAVTRLTPETLVEELGDIGFVVDYENADTHDPATVSTGR